MLFDIHKYIGHSFFEGRLNFFFPIPLPDLFICGIGYHHAGMDVSDRKSIEKAFTVGDLPVLCKFCKYVFTHLVLIIPYIMYYKKHI